MQGHSGRRRLGAKLLAQASNAYFEKFIEIAADNAKEAQTLQQRNARVLSKCQHPPVESKQRELAIDQRRVAALHGIFGCSGKGYGCDERTGKLIIGPDACDSDVTKAAGHVVSVTHRHTPRHSRCSSAR